MTTPQNNPHHIGTVGEHTLLSLPQVEPDKVLRLTMLFHDMGKAETHSTDEQGIDHFYGHQQVGQEIAKKILRRLKFDNDTIQQVTKLVFWHDYRTLPTPKAVRRAIHQVGEDLFPLLLKVQRADCLAQSNYLREEKTATDYTGREYLSGNSQKKTVRFSENPCRNGKRPDTGRYAAGSRIGRDTPKTADRGFG